jgi:hypothetical protein
MDTIHLSFEYKRSDHFQADVLYFRQNVTSRGKKLKTAAVQSALWTLIWIAGPWRPPMHADVIYIGFLAIFAVIFLLLVIVEWARLALYSFRLWLSFRICKRCERLAEQLAEQFKIIIDEAPQLAKWMARLLYVRATIQPDPPIRYDFQFDDWGGRYQTSTAIGGLAWTQYKQLLENDQVFVVVYGKQKYWTIPKHVFADTESMMAFRKLLRCNIEGQDPLILGS